MKILHVISGLNDGGAEGVLFRLVTTDSELEHIVISMGSNGKYGPIMKSKGVKVFTLDMNQKKFIIFDLFRLFGLIRRIKPNILQTWMPHADLIAGILGKISGVEKIFWGIRHSNLDIEKANKKTVKIVRINSWLSSYIPDGIISNAKSASIAHALNGFSMKKMIVIPNGFDVSKLAINNNVRSCFRQSLGVDDDTFLIGMVARYDPQKDHENLLRSLQYLARKNCKFKCVLVGTGMVEENSHIWKLIHDLGLQDFVILLGQHSEISLVMNGIDLHVLSSSYGEAFPNVVAEAMACGTPCVVTNVGDAKDIVQDTGWCVDPEHPRALSDAIWSAYNEWGSYEWSRRILSARGRIEKSFSMESMVDSFHRAWRN